MLSAYEKLDFLSDTYVFVLLNDYGYLSLECVLAYAI